MTEEVEIFGKRYPVTIQQEPGKKTVWLATGHDAMGEYRQVKGRTRREALGNWRDAVKYQANDGPAPKPPN